MKKRNHSFLRETASVLLVSLTAMPAMAADGNPFRMRDYSPLPNTDRQFVQGRCGMCGGAMQGRCGGMTEGMMMGGAMPRALDPAKLPEPDTTGAKLVSQYCTQCHGLPSPQQHSADGWPVTVARMNTRMQWMSRTNSPMNIKAPTEDELRTLTAYLEKHAADPEAATAPDR